MSFLAICVLYLVTSYKKLLEKYSDIVVGENRSQVKKNIEREVATYVDSKVDNAINAALEEAVILVSKNARNVVNSMKRKSIEKLIEEQKGEEAAVAARFNEANEEIEKYKAEKFEDIRKREAEILSKISFELGGKLIREDDPLIMKALEDAKRSNIF